MDWVNARFPLGVRMTYRGNLSVPIGRHLQSDTREEKPMGFLPGEKETILRSGEALSEASDDDPRSRWIMGVGFAAVPAIIGVVILWKMLLLIWQWEQINPAAARTLQTYFAWGAGLLAISAFMHFHFYWSPDPNYHAIGWLGKNLAAGVLVIILLAALFRGFVG